MWCEMGTCSLPGDALQPPGFLLRPKPPGVTSSPSPETGGWVWGIGGDEAVRPCTAGVTPCTVWSQGTVMGAGYYIIKQLFPAAATSRGWHLLLHAGGSGSVQLQR